MSKGATPENYIHGLRLRSPVSSQVYLSILNGFQRFVAELAEDKSISQRCGRGAGEAMAAAYGDTAKQ